MSMKDMDQMSLALLHACATIFDQFPEQSSKTLTLTAENGFSSSCPVFIGKMKLEALKAKEAKFEAAQQAKRDATPALPPRAPSPPPRFMKPLKMKQPEPQPALPLRERIIAHLTANPGPHKPRVLAAELDVGIDEMNDLLEAMAADGTLQHEAGQGWSLAPTNEARAA